MTTYQKQQTKERFVSYYTGRFSSDLKRYYDIKNDFGDRTYPFVLSMASDNHVNTQRPSMRWEGVDHFNMFSVSVYFMSMCQRPRQPQDNIPKDSLWPHSSCS